MDTCSARPAHNNDFTLLDELGPEKKTNVLPVFLASQPQICFSHDNIVVSLKKEENRRILPIKNPATRIQMGLMGSFSHNNLARKVGNWDYIMCATKLRL